MKKIKNPFAGNAGYNCFGCSPHNQHGLKLEFFLNEDERTIEATWHPDEYLQGYSGVLHGGIQATVMDEIASWAVYVLLETAGVTSKIEVKYLKPVLIASGSIKVKASVVRKEKRLADIKVNLLDGNNQTCAEAIVQYFIYPQEVAIKKFNYPGIKAFMG